jgi:hypothetical protein
MNPGAVEEGAKVATGIVDGLKAQPLSLALIVLNLTFIFFTAWLAYTINQRTTHQYEVKDKLIAQLIERCRDNKTSNLP